MRLETPDIGWIFLLLGALFGTAYAVILPPLQAPDEFAHFYRAYSVSEGPCIAPRLTPLPVAVARFAAAFPPHLEARQHINSAYLSQFLHQPLDNAHQTVSTNEAINVYNCAPYTPAAAAIFVARTLSVSPVGILYAGRLANLAIYLLLVFLALHLLPDFRLPMFALALMPMSLNQAASLSWDAVSFSSAFFLCAYILYLAWDPAIVSLRRGHYLILGAAILFASLCKTNIWLAPLALFIPAAKFGAPRRKWTVLVGYFFLALIVIGGWNFINRANTERWIDLLKTQQIMVSDNLAFVYQHPFLFLGAFFRTWISRGRDLTVEFVGRLGWLIVAIPLWTTWLYVALLVLVSLTSARQIRLSPLHRLVSLGLFCGALVSMFIALWCANTPESYKDGVLHGLGVVSGVQGRYLIPFAFPLLLSLANTRLRLGGRLLTIVAVAVIITVNSIATDRIHQTFYFSGDITVEYNNQLVRATGVTGPDDKVFLLHDGRRQWVKNAGWITKHGYRWPDDVKMISTAQMQSIPEGPAITEE